jgi:hypothetical protein
MANKVRRLHNVITIAIAIYLTLRAARQHMDACCAILDAPSLLGFDLRERMGYYNSGSSSGGDDGSEGFSEAAKVAFNSPLVIQPGIFCVEWCLAQVRV